MSKFPDQRKIYNIGQNCQIIKLMAKSGEKWLFFHQDDKKHRNKNKLSVFKVNIWPIQMCRKNISKISD